MVESGIKHHTLPYFNQKSIKTLFLETFLIAFDTVGNILMICIFQIFLSQLMVALIQQVS